MDVSKLTLAGLKDLLVRVGEEMKNREKSDLDAARNEINAIAQRMGLSLKDLMSTHDSKGKVRKQTSKVAAQYRNPQDASQEWTGRGRQPKWVKALLASGKNLMSAKISG
jgi:DNA-binding protein H-NS